VTSSAENELLIHVEPAGMRMLRLTVEVAEARVQQEMQRAARRIARSANIPGFRKGKAPYEVIASRFGEEAIRREAADEMVGDVYRQALKANEITPYDTGVLEGSELSPLRFVFLVPLPPVVDLGNYRSLRLKPPRVQVAKKEVEQRLEQLRREAAVLEPAEGRAAEWGDVVVVAIEGRNEQGEILLHEEEAEILLEAEDGDQVSDIAIAQQIVGMKSDEERTFKLDPPADAAPVATEFTVRVLEVFDRILPKIDDDLARTVGSYRGLKELEADLKDSLREVKQKEADDQYADDVLRKVVEQAKVEYPPIMLEEMIDRLVEQLENRLRREQRMALSDYLKIIGRSEEDLRQDLQPQAEERLRYSLVLSEVADVEGIQVSDEEVEEKIESISRFWREQTDAVRERLRGEDSREMMVNELLVKKTVDCLVAIARGDAEQN